MYDASLEYIAASSIPEIRSFFWDVRRQHHSSIQSTLQRASGPVFRDNEITMQMLFGNDPSMGGGGYGMMLEAAVVSAAEWSMLEAA